MGEQATILEGDIREKAEPPRRSSFFHVGIGSDFFFGENPPSRSFPCGSNFLIKIETIMGMKTPMAVNPMMPYVK